MAKKRLCAVCGKDITKKTCYMAVDEATKKVVRTCSIACWRKVVMKGWHK